MGLCRLVKSQKGAFSIMYVMMLPFILAMFVYALDGSRALAKRARITDAVREAGIAIAAENNENEGVGKQRNIKLVTNYLYAYMPDLKRISLLNIDAEKRENSNKIEYIQYRIDAEVDFYTYLPIKGIPNLGETITVGSGDSGNVRKHLGSGPSDFIFVVDFSGSMDAMLSDGKSRIQALKDIIKELTPKIIKGSSQFGIVPFSFSVPEIGINNEAWCGSPMITKHSTSNIVDDYIDYNYFADTERYTAINSIYRDAMAGRAWDIPSNMANTTKEQIMRAINLSNSISSSTQSSSPSSSGALLTGNFLDYDRTLNAMFVPDAPIRFKIPYNSSNTLWKQNCQIGNYPHGRINPYIINLTNDLNQIAPFDDMKLMSGTHIASGILRGAAMMAKGQNERRVMIIISDGMDSGGPGNSPGWIAQSNPHLATEEFVRRGLCDRIRDGLKNSYGATDVSMFFIAINDGPQAADRARYWGHNCVGIDNSVLVSNAGELESAIYSGISVEETGHFYR